MTKQEVIGNSWILLFAGHETSGNTTHYSFLFLAIALDSQARLQADIDSIVGYRPPSDWTYETEMGSLYRSMVGATMNKTLRLMPPIIDIPKITRTPQSLTFDGKTITIPTNVFIHLSAVGVHRNPRYWPHRPSKISSKAHDLDDFVPERWFTSSSTKTLAQPRPLLPKPVLRTPMASKPSLSNAALAPARGSSRPPKAPSSPSRKAHALALDGALRKSRLRLC